jgi:hypothetical protein
MGLSFEFYFYAILEKIPPNINEAKASFVGLQITRVCGEVWPEGSCRSMTQGRLTSIPQPFWRG